MKLPTRIGIVLTTVWVLIFGAILYFNLNLALKMELNEWGDFLAGFSAPLALLWLVVGYFQQGRELALNTEALRLQQEELRRQVQETANLAANAGRQAEAAELLASLTKTEQEEEKERELLDAQPSLWPEGGSTSGARITTNFINKGGTAYDMVLGYTGEYSLKLSVGRLLENNQQGKLLLEHNSGKPLNYPIIFHLVYSDKFGNRQQKEYEYISLNSFRATS